MARSKTIKWHILRHNGVAFPPDYEPRGLSMTIRGRRVTLEPLQEEMLMAWAKKIGTPYVDDPVFQENFLASLRERWPDRFDGVTIADMDWTEMARLAESEKLANLPEERRKAVSAERKQLRDELKARYGHARVDDHEVEIGAYLIEPPGIFMGRGAHPLRGRWKPRVYSYQVTLNLDEDADPPPAPHIRPGDAQPSWDRIVNEHDSLWVARWLEELTGKVKYVWLAETSHLRQERERAKYDKAGLLEENLQAVRAAIQRGMRDREEKKRQVATVAYLIDRLAMRVGDEKDEDEADTVGASTLRVEHVNVRDQQIDFDFLGKDSVRWEKTLLIEDANDRALAENLNRFKADKAPGDQIFPDITSARVNDFLKSVMPGLSAKVFRTFHATTTVNTYLKRNGNLKKDSAEARKEYAARMANLQAAIMCNHKRTPPKTWAESLKKREQNVETLRAAKPDLSKLDEQVRARRAALDKLRADQEAFRIVGAEPLRKKQAALEALQAQGAPTDDKKLVLYNKRVKAAAKAARAADKQLKYKTRRYKERVTQAQRALDKAKVAREQAETSYKERLERAELQLDLVRQTKDYALNTSLKNYIDPRVYKEWGEQVNFDWKKLYTGSLQRKFTWAMQDDNGNEMPEEE